MNSAYIITNDTLLAVGLRHILNESFSMTAQIVSSTNVLIKSQAANEVDFLLTDETTFAVNANYFSTQKNKTIIITSSHSDLQSEPLLISRKMNESDLIEALEDVFANSSQNTEATSQQNKLSAREIEVLKLVVRGHINKEIADKLNISINTVLTHRKNITSKLGIKSVSGLSIYAMMNGIIDSDTDKLI